MRISTIKFLDIISINTKALWALFPVFVLMLATSYKAYPQKVWTLHDCIQFSKSNNLTIQHQYYEKEKFHLRSTYTKSRFLPVVDARWRSANNWGFLIDPSTNILDHKFNFGNLFAINANWDLFNGQITRPIVRLRLQELAVSQYTYETAITHVALQLTQLYMQALLSHEQVKTAKQRVLQLQNQLKLLQQQLAKGVGNKREILNFQSQVASEELQVVYAENALDKAIFDVMQLMGLHQDNLIEISTVEIPDSVLATEYPVELSSAMNEPNFSEFGAAQAQVEAATTAVVVARNNKLPVLSINAQIATRTSSFQKQEFDTQLRSNFNQQIGFTLSVPIFNSLIHNNIAVAKLELESANTSYRQVQAEVTQQVFSAKLDYKAAYRKFIASQLRYKALIEEYRFAEKQFQLGVITAIEYGEVRNRFSASQSELLQNKYECFFKLKILQYYQGKGLE